MNKVTICRLGVAGLVVLALLVGGISAAYAEGGEGVISGKVENKTQGGGSTAGLEVTLHTMAHQTEGDAVTTTTDNDGNFRFEKLVTANNYAYSVSVKYEDITYGTDTFVFQSGETSKTGNIEVYEPTDKPDAIRIERAHIIIGDSADAQASGAGGGQALPVMEILIVQNDSDHVYVAGGPDQGTLRVALPPEAKNLQLAPELAPGAIPLQGGFAYADPLLPGQSQLLYSYLLPYTSDRYDLSRTFEYPVKQISVLIPDKGVKASSAQLTPQPSRNMGGQNYLILQSNDLPAGTAVGVHLEGLPMPSLLSALPEAVRWGVPAVIGVGFLGAIAFVLIRRRGPAPAGNAGSFDSKGYSDEEEWVDEEDDDFEDEDDEEIPEEESPKTRG